MPLLPTVVVLLVVQAVALWLLLPPPTSAWSLLGGRIAPWLKRLPTPSPIPVWPPWGGATIPMLPPPLLQPYLRVASPSCAHDGGEFMWLVRGLEAALASVDRDSCRDKVWWCLLLPSP